ncbi:hypothetical protein [Sporolactobacillus inulinus]|uniref:hypothetical protein n=1 Tax=Sporolactobacillus inulinus TaxID=2078 RepID=UPI001ED9B497|nr:hypothetical protein [Sporolactobacillus inulinus]
MMDQHISILQVIVMTKQSKIIGGFFSLELPNKSEYHQQAVHLNSARYALEYVLRVRHYKKIYLPAYLCDSVLQPIKRLGVTPIFYPIDARFAPVLDLDLEPDTCLYYVNYFGVNGRNVRDVCLKSDRVIIDNTQAFFERPLAHADTLYSARKFFGVPDGGYLYTDAKERIELERDPSYYRFDALLKQMDLGSVSAEPLFQQNEHYLDTCGLHAMARATQRILSSIDYARVRTVRNANFRFLHEHIGKYNQLQADFRDVNGPLCYPFLIDRGSQLKQVLIEQGIYTDDFWEETASRIPADRFEHHLAENLAALPIDQRYGQAEMQVIAQVVQKFIRR